MWIHSKTLESYTFRRKVSLILLLLALPAVLWLFYNNAVNTHSHLLSDGFIISHAHPYEHNPLDSGPGKSHPHSKQELFLLSLLWITTYTLPALYFLGLIISPVLQFLQIPLIPLEPVRKYFQVHNYRAPPPVLIY